MDRETVFYCYFHWIVLRRRAVRIIEQCNLSYCNSRQMILKQQQADDELCQTQVKLRLAKLDFILLFIEN